MGIYLNPKNVLFQRDLKSEIYVDKSLIIEKLNNILDTTDNFLCISRPRRFGKTMITNLISAFYSKGCDSRELFSNLKIAKVPSWDKNLNKFNVIKINLVNSFSTIEDKADLSKEISRRINKELIKAFPNAEIENEDDLSDSILKAYANTDEQFILIIDEYDLLVREQVSEKALQSYLEFLNRLFKSPEVSKAIHFAYLTGILPIVKDKIQSKLNEFKEFSMTDAGQLSGFIGFTEEEVKDLCDSYNMDFAECKKWYNGYKIGSNDSIYNPKSVVRAMTEHQFGEGWTKTGSYESIKDHIKMNFDGIQDDIISMIGGSKISVNIYKYLNTATTFHSKDDVYTYLIHLGYLAYDEKKKVCWIPNNEIRSEWINAIEDEVEYSNVIEMVKESKELLNHTINGDADYVAAALDKAHIIATNPKTYNNEGSFQSAICLAYFYAYQLYTVIQELPTGKGYADVVFLPVKPNDNTPALVVELKKDKTTQTAMEQIKNNKYGNELEHYTGNMILVGINYDSQSKKHYCEITRLVK